MGTANIPTPISTAPIDIQTSNNNNIQSPIAPNFGLFNQNNNSNNNMINPTPSVSSAHSVPPLNIKNLNTHNNQQLTLYNPNVPNKDNYVNVQNYVNHFMNKKDWHSVEAMAA